MPQSVPYRQRADFKRSARDTFDAYLSMSAQSWMKSYYEDYLPDWDWSQLQAAVASRQAWHNWRADVSMSSPEKDQIQQQVVQAVEVLVSARQQQIQEYETRHPGVNPGIPHTRRDYSTQ